jgi:acyl-CoA hydrolase
VDEVAWIAASLDYPGCKFVTVAMDKVEFRKSVRQGSILRFDADRTREGTTSVHYIVNVFRDELETGKREHVFTTGITFVCLDGEGKKRPVTS